MNSVPCILLIQRIILSLVLLINNNQMSEGSKTKEMLTDLPSTPKNIQMKEGTPTSPSTPSSTRKKNKIAFEKNLQEHKYCLLSSLKFF